MLDRSFSKSAKVIATRLNEAKIPWALIGSANLALQGLPVQPKDLDIVVRLDDLSKIQDLFRDFQCSETREFPTAIVEPTWEVVVKLDDIDVQFLGEQDTGPYVDKLINNQIQEIVLDGVNLTCLTLDAEADAYAETDRSHKAEMIRNYLKKQNHGNNS